MSSSVQRPYHHNYYADQKHQQADAIDTMHETQARIPIATAKESDRVEVMKYALEEHRPALLTVNLATISGR
jgi:hypothetical protein